VSSKESTGKTLFVAFCLCVVCSIVVSATAVVLKPLQDANKELDRNKNILQAAGLFDEDVNDDDDVMELFQSFTPRVVSLEEGRLLNVEELAGLQIDTQSYDQRLLINDVDFSEELERSVDIANIKRRVIYPMIYTVEDGDDLETIVVPINGYGLWGIIYGFLALEGDANTVKGLSFYELKETPGLGAEVRNPSWIALWPGKKVYDEQGEVGLRVVKGQGSGDFQVDGLAGATLTSKGVDNLVRYWLGEDGYGPLLAALRDNQQGGF
jgi:Na+-transporting NADH:ubiquinone oxidoreductase subunit C